ncbi:MAG: hypothetical protein M3317_05360, partial [Actinomycetota bacterium]|nr:hypothetical protein [Actinomycetota bacterium]
MSCMVAADAPFSRAPRGGPGYRFLRTREVRAISGQLHGHHLHHPSIAETYHRYLAPHSYQRLETSRVGLLGGERQH